MVDPSFLPEPYQPQAPAVHEPVLLTIGDISLTRTEVILPHGRFPLRGSSWTVQDSSNVTQSIPVYAIVLTVIFFFFCFLGLLFLLIKETKYNGFISVTVVGEGFYHSVQLPPGPQMGGWVAHQVGQARAMAASA